jgi:hypothetical protein
LRLCAADEFFVALVAVCAGLALPFAGGHALTIVAAIAFAARKEGRKLALADRTFAAGLTYSLAARAFDAGLSVVALFATLSEHRLGLTAVLCAIERRGALRVAVAAHSGRRHGNALAVRTTRPQTARPLGRASFTKSEPLPAHRFGMVGFVGHTQ